MRFLITGHTGFKGSWLTILLSSLGHSVCGFALDPADNSLFNLSGVSKLLDHDVRGDVRDLTTLQSAVDLTEPDVIVHLAAQPLVRESYDNPQLTIETNVIGTMNVLTASERSSDLRAVLVITTDKVYRNVGKRTGYLESDPLGGVDPYSASKAMADILCQSWITGISKVPVLILRAGNVIGGGDRARDRIVPDLVRGFSSSIPVSIRNPDSIRPWQHVLDCLNGYMLALDSVLKGSTEAVWNIGPSDQEPVTVGQIAQLSREFWGSGDFTIDEQVPVTKVESSYLTLNSNKARSELQWKDHLVFPASLEWTINWEKELHSGADAFQLTSRQVVSFLEMEPRLRLLGE